MPPTNISKPSRSFAPCSPPPASAPATRCAPAAELGLIDPSVADKDIIEAMIAHPILVERPIVVTAKGTTLCRPSEQVLDLLDRLPPGPFAKEDGELVIDAEGKRIG
jgi:arsenate reductase (glutaredoxin)